MNVMQLIFVSLAGLLLVACSAQMEGPTAVPTRIPATNTPVVEAATAVAYPL